MFSKCAIINTALLKYQEFLDTPLSGMIYYFITKTQIIDDSFSEEHLFARVPSKPSQAPPKITVVIGGNVYCRIAVDDDAPFFFFLSYHRYLSEQRTTFINILLGTGKRAKVSEVRCYSQHHLLLAYCCWRGRERENIRKQTRYGCMCHMVGAEFL